jgi:hypothetical protein
MQHVQTPTSVLHRFTPSGLRPLPPRRRSDGDVYVATSVPDTSAPPAAAIGPRPPSPRRAAAADGEGYSRVCADLPGLTHVRDIASDCFPDLVIAAPERAGDRSTWRAFHVGRDRVAQASCTLGVMLRCGMRETHRREIIMENCQADAAVLEKALRALYGAVCEPEVADAVELASLLDYFDPHGMPDGRWEALLAASIRTLRDGINDENALAIWERAHKVDEAGAQQIVARYFSRNPAALESAAALDEGSFEALLEHPSLVCREDRRVEVLLAWGRRHAPEGTDLSTLFETSPFIPLIRWERVTEACLWASVEAGLLSLEEAGAIGQVRFHIAQDPECAKDQRLFDAPLREARRWTPQSHDAPDLYDLEALEAKYQQNLHCARARERRRGEGKRAFIARANAIRERVPLARYLREEYDGCGRWIDDSDWTYGRDEGFEYHKEVPRDRAVQDRLIDDLMRLISASAAKWYATRIRYSTVDDSDPEGAS